MIAFTLLMFWIIVAFIAFMVFLFWVSQEPQRLAGTVFWIIVVLVVIVLMYNRNVSTPETLDAVQRIFRDADKGNKDY